LLTSLKIIEGAEGAERRAQLQSRIAQWQETLRLDKWQTMASNTAIQPVVIGANDVAMQVAENLYERGIWVPAIRPPTVPGGTARLRVTLSAAHTTDDVAQLVDVLHQLEKEV
jgi:8-amino-7-oxononanoate synthase